MTNKRTFLFTGLVFCLMLVFGITTGAMADNIRIGVAAPFTGDLAALFSIAGDIGDSNRPPARL